MHWIVIEDTLCAVASTAGVGGSRQSFGV